MEPNSHSYREKLYAQIEESYGKIMYTYSIHIIHAGRLTKRNNKVKWAQIILSAFATGGFILALIKSQIISVVVGGLSSTILLILSTYVKDANLESLAAKHINISNKLWIIREKYLSLLTDFEELDDSRAIEIRNNLQDKVAEIYNDAPLTDAKSYALAQDALKNKETQFFSREELNKMLPYSLRK